MLNYIYVCDGCGARCEENTTPDINWYTITLMIKESMAKLYACSRQCVFYALDKEASRVLGA